MKHRLVCALVANAMMTTVFAGTMGPTVVDDWRWMASVSAGSAWANGGETQTFYLTPEIEKTYQARKSSNAFASGELFIGMQKTYPGLLAQLGLAAGMTGNAKLQGLIWDDADPQFINLRYNYKVRSSRIAVKGKFLFDRGYWLMPWLSGSVGAGFNRAHDFTNTPLIFEALPNSNFNNSTKTAFTYTLGAGLQKIINTNWQIGIGYEFSDWGKSNLDRAFGQTLNTGLSLNHLYTNGVLVNLTYIV